MNPVTGMTASSHNCRCVDSSALPLLPNCPIITLWRLAVGRGPRSVGRPDARAGRVSPSRRVVQGLARRARWAVAARTVERAPTEEEVVWPMRVACAEAMRA